MSQAVAKARSAKTSMYRALIVDAAERLFATRGYEGSRIQEIAAESGVSLGTLYSVFEGKSDILSAVHDERLGELFQLAGRALGTRQPAAERLLEGNRVFIGWLTEHPDYLQIHLNDGVGWASDPRRVEDGLVAAWRRGIDLIAGVIAEAARDGHVHDEDPKILARVMVAIQQVYMSAWVEAGMCTDPRALAKSIEKQIQRTLFNPEQRT
ncbi:MAG: TetR/AcrR family transcriptional regulator [Polyangiales bacterium]